MTTNIYELQPLKIGDRVITKLPFLWDEIAIVTQIIDEWSYKVVMSTGFEVRLNYFVGECGLIDEQST